MRLLIDTHIALWAVGEPEILPERAIELMRDAENSIFVSSVSIWEVSIKYGLRRGKPGDVEISGHAMMAAAEEAGMGLLAFTPDHAAAVDRLAPHHRDPFDRALVAQALSEPMYLVTHDRQLAAYGDHVMLV